MLTHSQVLEKHLPGPSIRKMASCSADKKLKINVNTCVGHQGIPPLLSQENNITNILDVSEVGKARPKKKSSLSATSCWR